ncbi:MAG: esterase family protein, partial [Candidatus Sumerlaeota bacterium]
PDPTLSQDNEKRRLQMKNIFGDLNAFGKSKNDLLHLATQLKHSERKQPALFACCGTEDFLYEQNQTFRRHAESIDLQLDYEEGPGSHDWSFWDHWIQRVLEWLPSGTQS